MCTFCSTHSTSKKVPYISPSSTSPKAKSGPELLKMKCSFYAKYTPSTPRWYQPEKEAKVVFVSIQDSSRGSTDMNCSLHSLSHALIFFSSCFP